ncbi:mechanosensory transduction mediator stumble isoform 2-T3 [Glossina fuscipes fuscipes]
MKPSSSSSLSTSTSVTASTSQRRLISCSNSERETPAIIPLDYNYHIMAPSSHQLTYNARSAGLHPPHEPEVDVDIEVDYPYSSLFGDPIPPPPPDDYFGAALQTPPFLRCTSLDFSSEEDHLLNQPVMKDHPPSRLFSQVPYTSALDRKFSSSLQQTAIPRLKPPDIHILPNTSSGGGSSSEKQQSPNLTLSTSYDNTLKPSSFDINENMKTSKGHTEGSRRVSNISADFQAHVGGLSCQKPSKIPMPRQFSQDSFSSGEWFRSSTLDYPEFCKMPKLRPSSKNVMSIKCAEMPTDSPVAAMINDSNGSSSEREERLMQDTQVLEAPSAYLEDLQIKDKTRSLSSLNEAIVLSPREYIKQRRKSVIPQVEAERSSVSSPVRESAPSLLPKPLDIPETIDETQSFKHENSPVILKDSITTGGDFRIEQGRFHKKPSFTILSEKSPQSSRAQSPQLQKGRIESTPLNKRYLQQKSLSSHTIKFPQLTHIDDSSRPSVQFNMTGKYNASKLPTQKGILQYRESLTTSSQDTLPPQLLKRRNSSLPSIVDETKVDREEMKSCETLPLITDPYRSSIPRISRSDLYLRPETAVIPPGALPRPLKHNPNPTRKQKGLLKVFNNQESLSKIPLRSNWESIDDMWIERRQKPTLAPLPSKTRRRSSSTSPSRRSSTVTTSDRRSSNLSTVTTSDFSFRRPSLVNNNKTMQSSQLQRRKSVFQIPSPAFKSKSSLAGAASKSTAKGRTARVAKPTTLSPILGTPNKDSGSISPSRARAQRADSIDAGSDSTSRRDSLSKIPVPNQVTSRSNSRMSSQPSSRVVSRSSSPLKEISIPLSLSGRLSRASERTLSQTGSKTVSRVGSRTTSRANSRTPSRSTSRASTRPLSLPGSRPLSRMEQAKEIANSRSNSRLSLTSIRRGGSVSPNVGRKAPVQTVRKRRISVSLSPKLGRRLAARRTSISPTTKRTKVYKRSRSKSRSREERKTSQSRIPISKKLSRSKSPPKTKAALDTGLRRISSLRLNSTKSSKPHAINKKTPNSQRKLTSDVKRVTSVEGKKKLLNLSKKESTNLKKSSTSGNRLEKEKSSLRKKVHLKNGGGKLTNAKTPIVKEASATTKQAILAETKGKTESISALAGTTIITASDGEKIKSRGAASTVGLTAAAIASLKRQPSAASLIRVSSRLSMLNKKRSDGNPSKQVVTDSHGTEIVDHNSSTEDGRVISPLKQLLDQQHLAGLEGTATIPAAILEKSQKTLESVQKTVTVATDEIHKTINENLTNLKSLEQDMGITSNGMISPTSSVTTVVENKPTQAGTGGMSVSRQGTAEKLDTEGMLSLPNQTSPTPPSQPIEAAVSILNGDTKEPTHSALSNGSLVDHGAAAARTAIAANDRTYQGLVEAKGDSATSTVEVGQMAIEDKSFSTGPKNFENDVKRRSPDGQGGSQAGSGASQEYLENKSASDPIVDDVESQKGCCRCCSRICMPCRRSHCSRCCRRDQKASSTPTADEGDQQPVLSATSSATTTNLEVINEKSRNIETNKKTSCWQKLNCCRSCQKQSPDMFDSSQRPAPTMVPPKQSKCGLCLSKIFCCRSVNKIDPTTGDETVVKKCCFCIPCRKKRETSNLRGSSLSGVAWQDPEIGGVSAQPAELDAQEGLEQKEGCCKRFCNFLLCCRKSKVAAGEGRRASIKQPPVEDTRNRLHVDLVEYNSKMKGAIPILPLYLAWFCAICNVLIPGLGTLLSGFFCICVGIPRFSQFDSAKARVGSLIINIIVATAQLFCVLFCFVGWGWSIWWASIMLKVAKKLNKIRKVERMEMEEEKRQAEAAAAAAATAAATKAANPTETEASKA